MNKPVDPNARAALNQMKLEISHELGVDSTSGDGSNSTSYQNGELGGRVGGQMSKKLVQMGEETLIKGYNKKS